MGVEKLLADKIKAGQKKRLEKKKAASKSLKGSSKKETGSKKEARQPYQEEAKPKKKKPTRIRLTPLPYDDAEYISKLKNVSIQRAKLADSKKRKGVVADKTKKSTKKGAVVKGRKGAVEDQAPRRKRGNADAEERMFTVPTAPSPEEETKYVAERAIVGDASLPDPLEGLSLPSNDFVAQVTQAKAEKTCSDKDLLQRAHDYFTKLNSDDQRRNRQAFQRLREMKRINKQGGDKDGFKFVIPKSVTTIVRQIAAAEGVEGADVEPESLSSQFIGDGVAETSAKPMRSYKPRKQCFDDFYQFQVAKKWTKNAESFLARGRMTKKMFTAKQGQNRSIRKM